MKNISIFFLLLIPFLGMISCDNTQAKEKKALEQEQILFDQVMALHDEVMPKTNQMNKIGRQLKKHLKENPELEMAAVSKIKGVVKELDRAEDAMYEWMENVKQLKKMRETKSHEEIISHLKKENEIMTKVNQMTDKSLQAGKEIWASLQPQ